MGLIALSVAIVVAWAAWLRPVALGGAASYVVVQGHSMEPTYQDGDLVLVRKASAYGLGDIIAFRAGGQFKDPTRIIHRIVGEADDDSFQTQGDNRDALDPWTPGADDIIGKAALHIPMAGRAAGFLTSPATLGALGGAAVVVGGQRRRRRRRRAPLPAGQETPQMKHLRDTGSAGTPLRRPIDTPSGAARMTHPRWAFVGLTVSILLALPLLAVTWSALQAPDSTQRVVPVGHIDSAIGLDYRFTGAKSAVYPTGEVTTSKTPAGAVMADGPLYSRLLDVLRVDLDFQASESGADGLASTYAVEAHVETPGGWSMPLDSIDAKPFEGAAAESLSIDLRQVASKVASVAALTGVGGNTYTIKVAPTLDFVGDSRAGRVQKQLTAPMSFEVADNLITANAIEASERKDISRTIDERATYALGPLGVGTQAARGLLGGLTLVVVAAIVWFASVLFAGVGLGEPERIATRYRSQIVDVSEATSPPGPVVMVSAIDELARIARMEQTVILHEDLGDGAHRYRAFLGTVTYEYETAPEHGGGVTAETTSDLGETEG